MTRSTVAGTVDMRSPVSAEGLATWAIRDQQADRTYTGLHRVEACAGAAMRIRQQPHRFAEYDFPAGYPMDSVARAMEIGDIGTRIDGGGPVRGVPVTVHPDAELVLDAIQAIPNGRQRGLVLEYARLGDRPDWSNGTQTLAPLPVPESQRGRTRHAVRAEWENLPAHSAALRRLLAAGHRIVDQHGARRFPACEPGFAYRVREDGQRQVAVRWCPVEPVPSDAWIANTNAIYAAWHAGMTILARTLVRLPLRDHRCTGFDAPAEPWR